LNKKRIALYVTGNLVRRRMERGARGSAKEGEGRGSLAGNVETSRVGAELLKKVGDPKDGKRESYVS